MSISVGRQTSVEHACSVAVVKEERIDVKNIFLIRICAIGKELFARLILIISCQADRFAIERYSELGCLERSSQSVCQVKLPDKQVSGCDRHAHKASQASCTPRNQFQAFSVPSVIILCSRIIFSRSLADRQSISSVSACPGKRMLSLLFIEYIIIARSLDIFKMIYRRYVGRSLFRDRHTVSAVPLSVFRSHGISHWGREVMNAPAFRTDGCPRSQFKSRCEAGKVSTFLHLYFYGIGIQLIAVRQSNFNGIACQIVHRQERAGRDVSFCIGSLFLDTGVQRQSQQEGSSRCYIRFFHTLIC